MSLEEVTMRQAVVLESVYVRKRTIIHVGSNVGLGEILGWDGNVEGNLVGGSEGAKRIDVNEVLNRNANL